MDNLKDEFETNHYARKRKGNLKLTRVSSVSVGRLCHHGGALRGHRKRRLGSGLHGSQGLLHRLLPHFCKSNTEKWR